MNVSPRRPGFTLVELLVVIGIIALLISILLPSLNKARGAAQKVACQSNIRQMGLAGTFYNNDNKGFFPQPDYGGLAMGWDDPACWWNAIPDKLGFEPLGGGGPFPWFQAGPTPSDAIPVLRCPSANLSNDRGRTYAMNANLNQYYLAFPAAQAGSPWAGLQAKTLPVKYTLYRNQPMLGRDGSYWSVEDVPLYMDGWLTRDGFGNAIYEQWRAVRDNATQSMLNTREAARPHDNGMNVMFIDGHVEFAGPKHKLFTAPADGAADPKAGAMITDETGTKNRGWIW